jgi:hypothetical protein
VSVAQRYRYTCAADTRLHITYQPTPVFTYSLYTDFAYRDASGSYTKLYVTVTGVVEALQDRLDKRGRSMAKVPQPRATLRLKLTPHMLVFLGEEPRRTSEISVDDLGLVMADNAPSDDDDPEPAAPPPPPSKRARRSREARASTPDSDYSSDDDL